MNKSIKWKLAQRVELKWWKNYLKNKDINEYSIWKKKYWQDLINQVSDVVKIENNQVILDAGCGPTGVFMILDNCKVDAIDPLLNEYDKSLSHFNRSHYPNTNFYSSSIEDFTTETKYDTIFCMNAINHVSNLNNSFDKICDYLKPDGQLLITIDAHNFSFFKHIFRLIPGDVLHPHQYDIKEYEQMLTSRECTIIKNIKLKKEFFFDHYLLVVKK